MSELELDNVSLRYVRDGAGFYAVRQASLTVARGETVALVGESGSGKSTLARAAVGLVPIAHGSIRFAGKTLPRRGRRPIGMVFQDPLGSLDPAMTIGAAITEILAIHGHHGNARLARLNELLDSVGLPADAADRHPRQLSGGQQQRAAIARALAADPQILILDEPVSALDVSVRAQVLQLLADLRKRLDIGYLFIAHDLAVVRQLADRVAVMYRGRIVETAPAANFFEQPLHPYSKALLAAVPSLRRVVEHREQPPRAAAETACVYAHRCPWADARSLAQQPPLEPANHERAVACFHWREIAAQRAPLAGASA